MKAHSLALLSAAVATACLHAQGGASTTPAAEALQWKDLTKSGIPIRFYGFLRFEVHYNTARMDSVVIPTRVLAETTKRNDNQIHFDPRLTRFGFDVTPVKVNDTTVTGKLEIDFANFPDGASESRATPRIRLAYIDVGDGEFALRAGQDWDTISPLFPSVNNEMLMWNAGNLGDRRPQLQGRWTASPDTEVKVALGLTGAINNQDLDTPAGERDGFDSGVPHLQVRARTRPAELVEKKPVELGVWGVYGQTETDTRFNGENRFDIWTVGLDLVLPVCSCLTVRGEAFTGENLGDLRGGIGQTINTDTGNGIGTAGGWAELVYQATAKTKFHVGGALDDPKNDDLSTTLANANRSRNVSGYCGTAVDWDSGVRTGLDVTYWETEYANATSGNAVRIDLWFHLNF